MVVSLQRKRNTIRLLLIQQFDNTRIAIDGDTCACLKFLSHQIEVDASNGRLAVFPRTERTVLQRTTDVQYHRGRADEEWTPSRVRENRDQNLSGEKGVTWGFHEPDNTLSNARSDCSANQSTRGTRDNIGLENTTPGIK